MNVKALFLDLDGTLLNDDKEITAGNRNAINQALKEGHKVIITTGRPLSSAILQGEKLGLTSPGCYIIAFNGGIIYDMGAKKVIYKKAIPLALAKEIFEEAARRGIHIQTYDPGMVYVKPDCSFESVERYCDIIKISYKVIDDLDELPEDPVKCLCIDYEKQDDIAPFRDWINANYAENLFCFFSCKTYIEIIPKGLGKGTALRMLAGMLGIPMENTYCAGDEENDLNMFEHAGTGCAMANAVPSVKAVADYITERDNNHDAIQEIIEKFILS